MMKRTYDKSARKLLAQIFRNAGDLVESGRASDPGDLGIACGLIRHFAIKIDNDESDVDDIECWFDECTLEHWRDPKFRNRLMRSTGLVFIKPPKTPKETKPPVVKPPVVASNEPAASPPPPVSDENLKLTFSYGTKMLLRQFLRNAIGAIDEDQLNDTAGLGVVAAHLRDIAHHLDTTIRGQEDVSPFEGALNGDGVDAELCKVLQKCPESWEVPWVGFILSPHLEPVKSDS